MATRLLLVRHGQTAWNVAGRIQGETDTPLDDTGRLQAAQLGRRLADGSISAIYASDLARSAETARIVWEHVTKDGAVVPLFLSPELRELRYGQWEGKTRHELARGGWLGALRRWQAGLPTPMPPGAEGRAEAWERVERFFACTAVAHPGETIVVVGHGGPWRMLLCRLLGIPRGRWSRVRLANGALSMITIPPRGKPRVDFVNDTAHLLATDRPVLVGPLQAR